MMLTAWMLAAALVAAGSGGAAREGCAVLPTAAATTSAAIATVPPAPWRRGDPADSLYRAARDALANGDYRRAATMFGDLQRRWPDSGYAGDALYWRAFALYKLNGTDELRTARQALSLQGTRYAKAATREDARTLDTRICGELARRGDAKCGEAIADSARSPCAGDQDMKLAALNALMNMRPEQAMPILKTVLAKRDQCSATLRRKAVFLVANQETPESADILLDAIRNDPDRDVQREAVWWLSQVGSDRAVSVLDSLLRTSKDDALQERAVMALAQNDNPKAHQILRDLAERAGTDDDLRGRAIFALGHFGDDAQNGEWLRQLYPRLKSQDLQERVLESIGNLEGAENQKWLLDIALDGSQPLELRKKALFWAGNGGHAAPELIGLYDRLKEPELKEQMLFVLSNVDEPAATDKLIGIAEHETNHELRQKAIFWLGQKDDPKVRAVLLKIIEQ